MWTLQQANIYWNFPRTSEWIVLWTLPNYNVSDSLHIHQLHRTSCFMHTCSMLKAKVHIFFKQLGCVSSLWTLLELIICCGVEKSTSTNIYKTWNISIPSVKGSLWKRTWKRTPNNCRASSMMEISLSPLQNRRILCCKHTFKPVSHCTIG